MDEHQDDSQQEPRERIARRLSRAGVASRRDAERMILEGRVSVNGRVLASPALDVTPSDRIEVDGKPLPQPEPARLWLYHKPVGLVTSARDEKGRPGVFDALPEGLPRVMSVGRLDLTSEGLLLLTNDGALKRQLELPSTGWLRKYRARVNGTPDEAMLEPLRQGITVEGERFQPMTVTIDRIQGANAWLTLALREGRNREVRRALAAVGLIVNRLIRISYGPFRLGELAPGEVEEVKAKVLRDQIGGLMRSENEQSEALPGRPARPPRAAEASRPARSRGANPFGDPSISFRGRAGAETQEKEAQEKPNTPHRQRSEQEARQGGARTRRAGAGAADRASSPARRKAGDAPRAPRPVAARFDSERPASDRAGKPRHPRRTGENAPVRPKVQRRAEASGERPRQAAAPDAEQAAAPRKERKPRSLGSRHDKPPDHKEATPERARSGGTARRPHREDSAGPHDAGSKPVRRFTGGSKRPPSAESRPRGPRPASSSRGRPSRPPRGGGGPERKR